MRMRALSCLLLAAAVTVPAAADDSKIDFEARYWTPDLTGELQFRRAGIGAAIDLQNDLALGPDEPPEARLTFNPTRKLRLRAAYLPIAYAGDGTLARTIDFSGQTFALSTRVVSDLELEYGRVGLAWQFVHLADGKFRLGPLVEAKLFRGTASIAAPDLPIQVSETEEFEAAFPSAGLLLEIEPNSKLCIFAEGSALVGTDRAEVLDAEAGIRYLPTSNVSVFGGYRILSIDAEENNDLLNLEIEGVFAGVSLRF